MRCGCQVRSARSEGDGAEEQVKLMDPGFGATRGGVAGNLDLGPGTPEYWSPEHARGSADARSAHARATDARATGSGLSAQ